MRADQQDNDLNQSDENAAPGGDGGYSDNGEQLTEALSAGGEASFIVSSDSPRSLNKSTVFLFAVLVLGAGSIWFMYKKAGPKSAAAATSKETVEAKKTISTFLSGGDSNIKLMETMLKNTQKVVQQFLSYPSMTQIPLSDLRTNPFRFKVSTPTAQASGNADDVGEKRRREEERLAIMKAVQGLQLQSIMYSDARRACMINNTLYREGQPVEGFSIEKIEQNSVIVKNGPYRFELRMQR